MGHLLFGNTKSNLKSGTLHAKRITYKRKPFSTLELATMPLLVASCVHIHEHNHFFM